jgi:simple sugar transport system ATP-binding protein
MSIIELRNVSKSFGNVDALQPIDFHINDSEILSLLGDNGAGKSTLVKLLSGVHKPDTGEIYFDGKRMQKWNAALSRRLGVETVYQDKALAERQSITRNIFMGRELCNRFGFVRVKQQDVEAGRLMRNIGFTSAVFSPDSFVHSLSGGERQGVAIARALYFNAKLIILDEPTAALSLVESEEVLNFVRGIKARGSSALFISHNIYHSYAVADRLVVLDRGRVVAEYQQSDISVTDLVERLYSFARGGEA